MEEESGEPILQQVVTTFLHHGDRLLAVVRDDLRTGRLTEVAEAAHSLAGSAAAIGAFSLSRSCRQLEQHAKALRSADCATVFESLESDYRAASEALLALVGERG